MLWRQDKSGPVGVAPDAHACSLSLLSLEHQKLCKTQDQAGQRNLTLCGRQLNWAKYLRPGTLGGDGVFDFACCVPRLSAASGESAIFPSPRPCSQ